MGTGVHRPKNWVLAPFGQENLGPNSCKCDVEGGWGALQVATSFPPHRSLTLWGPLEGQGQVFQSRVPLAWV